jgi:hypothetical protein
MYKVLLGEEILGIVDTESIVLQIGMLHGHAGTLFFGKTLATMIHSFHKQHRLYKYKLLGFFLSGALQPRQVSVLTAKRSIAPDDGAATATVRV